MAGDFPIGSAIEALESALAFGIHPSLEGISELTAALGDPQDAFPVVQVAGTNGKSSTARLIASLLHAEGFRCGLYTSPHLLRYAERIEVDGVAVTDPEFAAAVGVVVDAADRLRPDAAGTGAGYTEFELLTAAALWCLRERRVDFAVLEAGLGGRWDATSVATPTVAVITGVGLDHTHILGPTLAHIAAEKAAIIRPGCAPVLGPGTAGVDGVFLRRAEETHTQARTVREGDADSPVSEALTVRFRLVERPRAVEGESTIDVRGVHARYTGLRFTGPAYQAANVATAVAASEAALGRALAAERIRPALRRFVVPGRFQVLRRDPVLVADGAHNPQAAAVLAGAIDDAWARSQRRPHVILGVFEDKDAEGIVDALGPHVSAFICTASSSNRSRSADSLADIVGARTSCRAFVQPTVSDAVDFARREGVDAVATGSLTVAAEAIAAAEAGQ